MRNRIAAQKWRLSDFIVDHNRPIRAIVLVLVVVCAFLTPFTKVNYDLTSYLPDTEPSKVAINAMEEVFGYPGTARLVLTDVTLYEAKDIKDRISDITGVDTVIWCDTFVNIYQSSEFVDTDDIYDYYHDGAASMDITFEGGNTSRLTYAAIEEIEAIAGEKGTLDGMAPTHKFGQENTSREMWLILVLSSVLISLILILTTTNFFEPVLFFSVLFAAVVINKGTNIFLGTVSFMTNSVCIILQLATSMDYAIFLLASFERERSSLGMKAASFALDPSPEASLVPGPILEPEEPPSAETLFSPKELDKAAMKNALDRTIVTVTASSLTTFFGFTALCFMKFEIGVDLGIVLAKSILCSLFAVIFLMPSLVLDWAGLIEKFRHRSFLPDFSAPARVIVRMSPVLLIASIILAVPIYTAQSMNSFTYGVDAMCIAPGNEIYEAGARADELFGRSNLLIALFADEGSAKENELAKELRSKPYIKNVLSLSSMVPEGVPEMILPLSVTERFHKDGQARMLIYMATAPESSAAYRYTDEVTFLVESFYPGEAFVTGNTPVTMDMEDMLSEDHKTVNFLAMAAVFAVVAVSFRSIGVAIMAMIPIMLAIYSNMALPYLYGEDLIFMAYLVISSIQLGATIDYAISEISNYRLVRETVQSPRLAARRMCEISISSILTSGLILFVSGYTIGFLSSMPAVREVGHLVGRGGLISMCFVIFLMPGLLMILDPFVIKSGMKKQKKEKKEVENASPDT